MSRDDGRRSVDELAETVADGSDVDCIHGIRQGRDVMRPALTLLVVMILVCSQAHAQLPPPPNVLVDASDDGGMWWSPQYLEFVPRNPHQGKALADYWRSKGAVVDEIPPILQQLPEDVRRARETTFRRLSGRDIVVRVKAFPQSSDRVIAAYRDYVAGGGKLLLLSDFLRPGQTDGIAESFGVRLMGISRGENLIDQFAPHPITRNVKALSCGGVTGDEAGCGSGVVSVTGDNVTSLAFLSPRTYLDLNDDRRQDPKEPVGAAILGVIEYGRGVVVFMADVNTLQAVPQPLSENIYNYLISYKAAVAADQEP